MAEVNRTRANKNNKIAEVLNEVPFGEKVWDATGGGLTTPDSPSKRGDAAANRLVRDNKKRSAEPVKTEFELELLGESEGDTVFVHNVSGTEFHVPPTSFDPKSVDAQNITVFEVNQVLPFSKSVVSTSQFKKCILNKKLRLVSEEEANMIQVRAEKEAAKSNKSKVGVETSGLPKNLKAAANYIFDCEDIDELEGYHDLEEREAVVALLEERIEELEQEGE